jgi:hypothetical protein
MKLQRFLAGALSVSILLAALPAMACSPDLADDSVGEIYAGVQNGTFLSLPLGDLALDLHQMKLYSRDGKEQWPDYLFYIGAAAEARLLSVEAIYDNGKTAALNDLVAGHLDKQRAFLMLRTKSTDRGEKLSQRSGLADADQVLYVYNGKMVVDGVDGNELKQFGSASFRIITVHDHVVDVPDEVDAFLDQTKAMAEKYDYKLDLEAWQGAHVAKPRQDRALLGLNPKTCKWELVAVDAAAAGEKFTTHAVDDAIAKLQGSGQEL